MSAASLYNKLSDRSIRLLLLNPGEHNSPFQGKLLPTSLDCADAYEALSYTWGLPETADVLHCDGGTIPLTLNLVQALRRLRKTDAVRTIWIDQICINQNDTIERGKQVSLMGDVYRGASVVNIWLGEEDENTSLAMRYLPHLLGAFSDPEERDENGDEVPHVIQALGLLIIKSGGWTALTSLFERPYFRRMWIFQEVVLGQECIVYCGSYTASWNGLAKVALCLGLDGSPIAEALRVVRMIKELKRQDATAQGSLERSTSCS